MTHRGNNRSGSGCALALGLLVAKLVDEEIEAVATPRLRREILAAALRDAELSAMPLEPHELSVFTRTALRKALAKALGDSAANEICVRLGSALALSGSRRASTLPPPAAAPDTSEVVTAVIPSHRVRAARSAP